MKPVDSDSWFWNPERVVRLFETLKELANSDGGGLHFDHRGLTYRVEDHLYEREDTELVRGGIGNGMQILVRFGVLEPGKPGKKVCGTYRRAFHPNKLPNPFTWSHIEQYRGHRAERL